MSKKANPNLKLFQEATEKKFKKNGDLYSLGKIHVQFLDDVAWKFSLDDQATWHTGAYPSGMNSIKLSMEKEAK